MRIKRLLCPERRRKIPAQFSRVDHRLVRDKHIRGCGPEALALYLLPVTVANVRIHGETHRRPIEMFEEERPTLLPLPPAPYDVGIERSVTATSGFRVALDTNRYSVPSEYAGQQLTLRLYPDKLLLYHQHKLIAEHPRGYQRGRDFLIPDHQRKLLAQRRRARDQQLLMQLLRISARAEEFIQGLQRRRLNPAHHIRHTVALAEIYGADALARAIDDALVFQAFGSEYIANILAQRIRRPSPHPTRGPPRTRSARARPLHLPSRARSTPGGLRR